MKSAYFKWLYSLDGGAPPSDAAWKRTSSATCCVMEGVRSLKGRAGVCDKPHKTLKWRANIAERQTGSFNLTGVKENKDGQRSWWIILHKNNTVSTLVTWGNMFFYWMWTRFMWACCQGLATDATLCMFPVWGSSETPWEFLSCGRFWVSARSARVSLVFGDLLSRKREQHCHFPMYQAFEHLVHCRTTDKHKLFYITITVRHSELRLCPKPKESI